MCFNVLSFAHLKSRDLKTMFERGNSPNLVTCHYSSSCKGASRRSAYKGSWFQVERLSRIIVSFWYLESSRLRWIQAGQFVTTTRPLHFPRRRARSRRLTSSRTELRVRLVPSVGFYYSGFYISWTAMKSLFGIIPRTITCPHLIPTVLSLSFSPVSPPFASSPPPSHKQCQIKLNVTQLFSVCAARWFPQIWWLLSRCFSARWQWRHACIIVHINQSTRIR